MSQDLTKRKNKDDLNLYYSLKIISKIDSIVNDNIIEICIVTTALFLSIKMIQCDTGK